MKKQVLIFFIFLSVCGCASKTVVQKNTDALLSVSYKPVSGNVYREHGTRIEITCPLRAKGKDDYYYAFKKSHSIKSKKKYLFFNVDIHNSSRSDIRIPYESISIIGARHDEYLPLEYIVPDNNKTRFLIRNLFEYKNTPFIFGIMAFEPLPEWENEIKIQFQIEIGDRIDRHFAIFKRNYTK